MAANMAAEGIMAFTIGEAVSSRAHFREAVTWIHLFREGKLTVFKRALPPGSAAMFYLEIIQALVSLEYTTGADSILLHRKTVQPGIVAAISATSQGTSHLSAGSHPCPSNS
ncbi:hypothetical protein HPB50_008958 [Hyalomma asiaticum]|uniref:Uncharacterized protein n=1 Tax=Hyalomma asiaticum TaxID=266040 RepID=A0ACB7TCR3_HYAAI|nr:hypothetical protein HPB50_008958 [Hyalomma asiaticum]